MILSPKTKIDDLVRSYPFLLDFLAGLSPKYEKLKNPILRRTVGRVASLGQVAGFGDMPVDRLISSIGLEIRRRTGEEIAVTTEAGEIPPVEDKAARQEILKDIIRDLHQGGDMEELKRRFSELVRDASAGEIAEMEQNLINEGMAEEEVKRLCDIHVQVFQESLDGQAAPHAVPGHPLHTLREENRALEGLVARAKRSLADLENAVGAEGMDADRQSLSRLLDELGDVEKHYLKKEHQLFPFLEAKGVSGPSKVMWAIHDDIRGHLKDLRGELQSGNRSGILNAGRVVLKEIEDMVYKEEKILFPMSLETLNESDWGRVQRGEEEIGYAWIVPGTEWKPPLPEAGEEPPAGPASAGAQLADRLPLDTGALTLEEINRLLTHLPIEISFVDEEDVVRYYSDSAERIFTRTPAVIGRKVQNCHPGKSVHLVTRILEAFKSGEREAAEFWLEAQGRFVHIRYLAVRDASGRYRGCLEVTQDVTEIRRLTGEKRLLDWS